MRIKEIELINYRSFEHCKVSFDDYYSAISGKNNAGKSNMIRAMKILFDCYEGFDPFYDSDDAITFKRDLPRWLANDQQPSKKQIKIRALLVVSENADEVLFKLIHTFYENEVRDAKTIEIDMALVFELRKEVHYDMKINGIAINDEIRKHDIFEKIRTPRNFYFHNSTQPFPRYFQSRRLSLFADNGDFEALKKARERFSKALKNVAKRNKEEISNLIGRLKGKYGVEVDIPTPDFDDLPFALSLGDKNCSTPISEWGSGTQNQTHILLTLLRARKSSTLGIGKAKFSPIIVIEEPESFLHPSAQAEFGRILMDLSEEFNIQIITTTHSIYMLNNKNPSANILLTRNEKRGGLLDTQVVPMNKQNWMQPFSTVLGLSNETFDQWRDVIFSSAKRFIFVEGDTDKRYLEFFRKPKHGKKALQFEGEIYPYHGTGFLENPEILRFIIRTFSKVVITFDLDAKNQIEPKMKQLNLREGVDYICIGENRGGAKAIEGLLPSWVTQTVCNEMPDITDQAMSNDSTVRKSAQSRIKARKCELFIEKANADDEDCGKFYKLIEKLNKMVK